MVLVGVGAASLYSIMQLTTYKDIGEVKKASSSQITQLVKTAGALVKAGRFNCKTGGDVDIAISSTEIFHSYVKNCPGTSSCSGFNFALVSCTTYKDSGDPTCPISLTLECLPGNKEIKISPKIAGLSVPINNIENYSETYAKE